jgi:hypothetical protein
MWDRGEGPLTINPNINLNGQLHTSATSIPPKETPVLIENTTWWFKYDRDIL